MLMERRLQVNAIVGGCLSKMATFTPASLSHCSWAMAEWGTRNDTLMNAIADEPHPIV